MNSDSAAAAVQINAHERTNRMLLKLPAVMRETALGRSTIYAAVKAGTFPAPLRVGRRRVAWSEEEISKWRENLVRSIDCDAD